MHITPHISGRTICVANASVRLHALVMWPDSPVLLWQHCWGVSVDCLQNSPKSLLNWCERDAHCSLDALGVFHHQASMGNKKQPREICRHSKGLSSHISYKIAFEPLRKTYMLSGDLFLLLSRSGRFRLSRLFQLSSHSYGGTANNDNEPRTELGL